MILVLLLNSVFIPLLLDSGGYVDRPALTLRYSFGIGNTKYCRSLLCPVVSTTPVRPSGQPSAGKQQLKCIVVNNMCKNDL